MPIPVLSTAAALNAPRTPCQPCPNFTTTLVPCTLGVERAICHTCPRGFVLAAANQTDGLMACVLPPVPKRTTADAPLDTGISISLFVLLVLEWLVCAGCLRWYRNDLMSADLHKYDDDVDDDREDAAHGDLHERKRLILSARGGNHHGKDTEGLAVAPTTPLTASSLMDCFREFRSRTSPPSTPRRPEPFAASA